MPRLLPAGFVTTCQPLSAPLPPAGADWLHEIKHDSFRLMVRRDGARVRQAPWLHGLVGLRDQSALPQRGRCFADAFQKVVFGGFGRDGTA